MQKYEKILHAVINFQYVEFYVIQKLEEVGIKSGSFKQLDGWIDQ